MHIWNILFLDIVHNTCRLFHNCLRENSPTWLSGPGFYAPLHNLTPPASAAGRRRASLHKDTAWNAFWCNFYILVLEIRINFQTDVQCAEKVISKIILHKRWDLVKSWHSCHTWVYLTSKVLRTLDPERPDKRDKTGFAAWPGGTGMGVGAFFRVVVCFSLTVWAVGWIE